MEMEVEVEMEMEMEMEVEVEVEGLSLIFKVKEIQLERGKKEAFSGNGQLESMTHFAMHCMQPPS
jgi:hypothetical protein